MEQVEISARSVEEAIQRALRQLGVTREQVEVTVLNEGRAGILGFGAEEARVRVRLIEPEPAGKEPGIAEKARGILEELLRAMDIEASVEIGVSPVGAGGGDSEFLEVRGEDLGILIGRRGQTLAALQYMLRVIIANQEKTWVPVVIDIEGYKQRRYETLRALALRIADQVATRKMPVALRPMPAFERRIVHLTLADHPHVTTESTGMGEFRKVVIQPKPK